MSASPAVKRENMQPRVEDVVDESNIARGRSDSRSVSLPPTRNTMTTDETVNPDGQRSVKHLTCYWWMTKGTCKHSAQDCLYAHFDTGKFAAIYNRSLADKVNRSLHRASPSSQP
jgi:hypothetical protein